MSTPSERKERLSLVGKILREESSSILSDVKERGKNYSSKWKNVLFSSWTKVTKKLIGLKGRLFKGDILKKGKTVVTVESESGVQKVKAKINQILILVSNHKKNILIAGLATAVIFVLIVTTLALQSQRPNDSTVDIAQKDTYTIAGPKGLSVGPFYLRMDINKALSLLNTTFKESLLEDEGVPGEPNYRKVEIENSGRRLHIKNEYVAFRAASNNELISLYFSGYAMDKLSSNSYKTTSEFAQTFIHEKRIPELNVEKQEDGFWWYFESPHGYRLEINQSTKAVRIFLVE